MKKSVLFGLPMAIALSVGAWNYLVVHHPISRHLAQDQRNSKLTVWAYHRFGVQPHVIVIDLRGFSDDVSSTDVMRALLQAAEAHKASKFDRVVLAYKGTAKFLLQGDYFQTLGRDYGSQNPIYTLRTLPENVYRMDGSAAYGTWTGGVLGVMAKQMEDLTKFSRDWYLDDAVKESVAVK